MHAGDLIISENDKLINLTGLNSLSYVGGDLLMNSNMNLKTLDGLNVGTAKVVGSSCGIGCRTGWCEVIIITTPAPTRISISLRFNVCITHWTMQLDL